MEQYLIGKTIKEFRLRNNLSQEKLAGTTCAVSTLSRIENGDQILGWKLVEALYVIQN
jgi:transcriptional regulator with XRE-family HTH domain